MSQPRPAGSRLHPAPRTRAGRPARVLRAVACLATVTSILTAVGGGAGATTTHQSYWVPAGGTLRITGHGFGHGHGMSQYGAEGAAKQGLTAAQILAFYFPGTKPATYSGTIGVLIGAATGANTTVLPQPGLNVRDLTSGATYALPTDLAKLTRWRLAVVATKAGPRTQLSYLTSAKATWTPYPVGGSATFPGDAEFYGPQTMTLVTPYGERSYHGTLRLASLAPGSAARVTVNVVGLDTYVKGVVPGEMPTSWAPAALQAQAVAARSYAEWSSAAYAGRPYQICDSSACQVYGGASVQTPTSDAAVAATSGEVLTYRGAPAFTQFASSDGGWTSAGSVPYLPAQADPYDGFPGNPVHTWTRTVNASVLVHAYPRLGALRRIRVVQRDGNGQWGGRVLTVVLDGTRHDVTISGSTFAGLYGLMSPWFTIASTPIITRWRAIGGASSPVGAPVGRERFAGRGVAQRFATGWFYYSARTRAQDLYGPILTAYLGAGGPTGSLGLPTSSVTTSQVGTQGGDDTILTASFVRGTISYDATTGAITVTHTG